MTNNVGLTPAQEGYARTVIEVGVYLGATLNQIDAAIATCLVESGLEMYANPNVTGSVALPHDKLGTDHASVGLFQQQVPMWGPVDVCQSANGSANLFYQQLLAKWNPALTNGQNAQAVQVSAYPARYDEQMTRAEQIVNDLMPAQTISTASTGTETEIMANSDQILALLKITATPEVQSQVNTVYKHALGRDADPAGLAAYTTFVLNGGTIAQVLASVENSAEYKKKHG